ALICTERTLLIMIGDPVNPGRMLHGEYRCPPIHNAVGLGKETMAAYVNAVAFIVNGPRDTTHVIALFDHKRLYSRPAEDLEVGCQPGWPSSDDYGRSSERFGPM